VEDDGDVDVNGDGFSIQQRRLVFPKTQRINGRLLQKCITTNHFRLGYLTRSIDEGIDGDFTLYPLGASERRISRRDGRQQFGLLQLPPFHRRRGSGFRRRWGIAMSRRVDDALADYAGQPIRVRR